MFRLFHGGYSNFIPPFSLFLPLCILSLSNETQHCQLYVVNINLNSFLFLVYVCDLGSVAATMDCYSSHLSDYLISSFGEQWVVSSLLSS
jgi:hypothetical protein